MRPRDMLILAIAIATLMELLMVAAGRSDLAGMLPRWAEGGAIGGAVLLTTWVLTKMRFN